MTSSLILAPSSRDLSAKAKSKPPRDSACLASAPSQAFSIFLRTVASSSVYLSTPHPSQWQTGINALHIVTAQVGETAREATTAAIVEMTTETALADIDRGRPEIGRSAQIDGSAITMTVGNGAMMQRE